MAGHAMQGVSRRGLHIKIHTSAHTICRTFGNGLQNRVQSFPTSKTQISLKRDRELGRVSGVDYYTVLHFFTLRWGAFELQVPARAG